MNTPTLITVVPGTPIPEAVVTSDRPYKEGDKREPNTLANASLRHLGAQVTKRNKPTANAKLALSELERRKTRRAAKAEAKRLAAAAA